jgi:hypothetical protein
MEDDIKFNKPDDFDFIIHGEDTRFVIFEKTESSSKHYLNKMKRYWKHSIKIVFGMLDVLGKRKLNNP